MVIRDYFHFLSYASQFAPPYESRDGNLAPLRRNCRLVDQDQKRKLDNQCHGDGTFRPERSAFLDQFAVLISTYFGDKHRFFEDLLGQCDADRRAEMYQAIAPRLLFKALPLSDYEVPH